MDESQVPNFLAHYYEAATGPFVNLSDLPAEEAEMILERFRREGQIFASRRAQDYLTIRRELEERVRHLFELKGGRPQEWNADGKAGPDRYIEAQVWDDAPLSGFLGVSIPDNRRIS